MRGRVIRSGVPLPERRATVEIVLTGTHRRLRKRNFLRDNLRMPANRHSQFHQKGAFMNITFWKSSCVLCALLLAGTSMASRAGTGSSASMGTASNIVMTTRWYTNTVQNSYVDSWCQPGEVVTGGGFDFPQGLPIIYNGSYYTTCNPVQSSQPITVNSNTFGWRVKVTGGAVMVSTHPLCMRVN